MPPSTGLGLLVPPVSGDDPFGQIVALAVAAENGGLDSVWMTDDPAGPVEMCTVLGGLAARTSAIHLGALVGPDPTRSPALLAKQVTAVDVLSGGRALLGFDARTLDAPGDLARLEEVLALARAMFTEDAPTFLGTDYRITGAANRPPPVRPGGVPIGVFCSDDDDALGLAARHADRCLVTGTEPHVRGVLEGLARMCAQVGRDLSTITATLLNVEVAG